LFLLFAILAGAAVPVQFAVNSELRGAVGGTITAAAISFLVRTIVLGAAVLLVREGVSVLSDIAGAPWWVWVGGLLGAYYVAASIIILTPRLGAANTVTFIIAGQVLASMILDQFGLLNLSVYPASLARIGDGALVIAGVFVVLRT